MQRLINRAWNLRESITVVGREGNNYIVHFKNFSDHNFMLLNGPWAIDGALLIFELWEPNTILRSHIITQTLIWVQLWGLPLKYQQPDFVRKIAQTIGDVSVMDWDNVIPINIYFMQVRVWIDPNSPLLAGCMIKRDDGMLVWIELNSDTKGYIRFVVGVRLLVILLLIVPT